MKSNLKKKPKRYWTPKDGKWSKMVLQRDCYTCRMCGCKKQHGLEAHHILPYLYFPKHRYNIKNGITLCNKCHHKIPKAIGSILHKINIGLVYKQIADIRKELKFEEQDNQMFTKQ